MARRRSYFVALFIALIGVGLVGCQSDGALVAVYAWHDASTDSRTITLVVNVGETDEITRAEVLSETAESVTVAVWVRATNTDATAGVAVPKETSVSLHEPIGARIVFNDDGSVIPNQ